MAAQPSDVHLALFYHLTFPPHLPGSGDVNAAAVSKALINQALKTLKRLQDVEPDSSMWPRISQALETCKKIHATGVLAKETLLDAFAKLRPKDFLVVQIRAQNAGLFIRYEADDCIVFEGFEASLPSKSLLAVKGPLTCRFPGAAASIPAKTFFNPEFQDSTCAFLSNASNSDIKPFAPTTRKAGVVTHESRQTADPSLILLTFMTILRRHGSAASPKLLIKRVRDDAVWEEGSEKPWRRSPLWLIIRVSLQRFLCLECGDHLGRHHYKLFICLHLSTFLDEVRLTRPLCSEHLAYFRDKLSRRLAKLSKDLVHFPDGADAICRLFGSLSNFFEYVLTSANRELADGREKFKKETRRKIPLLPIRAGPNDMYLTLPRVFGHFSAVFDWRNGYRTKTSRHLSKESLYPRSSQSMKFIRAHIDLAAEEQNSSLELRENDSILSSDRCAALATAVEKHVDQAFSLCESHPEAMSLMILTVMDLWKAMDACACEQFPLLKQSPPPFSAGVMDVLFLSRRSDMGRLQAIESYMQQRYAESNPKSPTIFDGITKTSFAVQYYKESEDLQAIHQEIAEASNVAKKRKETEWEKKARRYTQLSDAVDETPCRCNPTKQDQKHKNCQHCTWIKELERMHVIVHEDFLPQSKVQAEAAVFELRIPHGFRRYRDATWKIIRDLALRGNLGSSQAPKKAQMILQKYPPLRPFKQEMDDTVLAFASWKKSWPRTHLGKCQLPVDFKDTLRPCGLEFGIFDQQKKIWLSQHRNAMKHLAFGHLIGGSRLLAGTPLANFDFSPPQRWTAGPTANEILASQPQCPLEMGLNEFEANLDLQSGRDLLWVRLLRELGSPNINFSSPAAAAIIDRLALQVGPLLTTASQVHLQQEDSCLRQKHWVFEDENFCSVLLSLTKERVEEVVFNWREHLLVGNMLTIVLRILELTPLEQVRKRALGQLNSIRDLTVSWLRLINKELRTCQDLQIYHQRSLNALWAALLCRRTYDCALMERLCPEQVEVSMQQFFEASICVHHNLPEELSQLHPTLLNTLIHDARISAKSLDSVRMSLRARSQVLSRAIDAVWPEATGRNTSNWTLMDPDRIWAFATTASCEDTRAQMLHYNLVTGSLLFDGQAIGRIPDQHRSCEDLKYLFGDRSLLFHPSPMHGMEYQLAFPIDGYEVHIGFRSHAIVVRARCGPMLLEYVPRSAFGDSTDLDIPGPLMFKCVHWLNLKSNVMYIRRHEDTWRNKKSEWHLDLSNRRLSRYGKSFIIDPHSSLFQDVCTIFEHVEPRYHILAYQTGDKLRVELPRLSLRFFVNAKGLLQCRQLQSVIPVYQDVGTFYGLRSMIVFETVEHGYHHLGLQRERQVLVPFGAVRTQQSIGLQSNYLEVFIDPNGEHAIYGVDSVLGRLFSPIERRLIYRKALLHALTNSVIPDVLTQRTGREEAIRLLQSGLIQPWEYINPFIRGDLDQIASLTPKRSYYPEDMRVLQRVPRTDGYLVSVQHDSYSFLILEILRQSADLERFQSTGVAQEEPVLGENDHLCLRHHVIHQSYSPFWNIYASDLCEPLRTYETACLADESELQEKVWECATLIKARHDSIAIHKSLAEIFHHLDHIGGFKSTLHPKTLLQNLNADLVALWGVVCKVCCSPDSEDLTFHLTYFFASLASTDNYDMDLIRIAIGFFALNSIKQIQLPGHDSYHNFSFGFELDVDRVREVITPALTGLETHDEKAFQELSDLSADLMAQWPREQPKITNSIEYMYIDTHKAYENLQPAWSSWLRNMDFQEFLLHLQEVLTGHDAEQSIVMPRFGRSESTFLDRTGGPRALKLSQMISDVQCDSRTLERFDKCDPILTDHTEQEIPQTRANSPKLQPTSKELQLIAEEMKASKSLIRRRYAESLLDSLAIFKHKVTLNVHGDGSDRLPSGQSLVDVTELASNILQTLVECIQKDQSYKWLRFGSLWPSITPISVLELLSTKRQVKFGHNMKEILLRYGVALTKLQRLLRILKASNRFDGSRVRAELNNVGHTNWHPCDFPNWLLIELDNNIMIREEQVVVALQTMESASGFNSVLQMNMGSGKSSVVLPMIAAELANGKHLFRVIVPRILLRQTASTLQSALGSLLSRSVKHVPYSRRTPTDRRTTRAFRAIHEETLAGWDVQIVLPEHLMSFKLSAQQGLLGTSHKNAELQLHTLSWMERVCRDVLDESDITLSPKTQLVYPSGARNLVDGHPHRWLVIETLLSLVKTHIWDIQRQLKGAVEVIESQVDGFPTIFFLRKEAEVALSSRCVQDILSGQYALLDCRSLSAKQRFLVKAYLLDRDLDEEGALSAQSLFRDQPAQKTKLLLLRGLFVYKILHVALQKRWNVEYGLHPGRSTPIAVPFVAKGVPNDQAEFGHPDLSILVTCLTFYYQGLSSAQLRKSFTYLSRMDDPTGEYHRWTINMPPSSLKNWKSVNIDDEIQWQELWRLLRFDKVTVDFFLNHFVFPLYAKQYETKISACGWDIPLTSHPKHEHSHGTESENYRSRSTGFSGTNDARMLLPLNIRQQDLPQLSHTNAEVLTYLLEKRSRSYSPLVDSRGRRLRERDFFKLLADPSGPIRVLIDAGALILEMSNREVAIEWLKADTEAQAAVYFDNDGRCVVHYRNKARETPLAASTYAENLEDCLVYLDEAHTRGVDLKFPPNTRGALTLALNQSKDHTVQAAMRLRDLARSQSVHFFAPLEVHQSIMDMKMGSATRYSKIDSHEVVRWLLEQTCKGVEDLQPVFYSQGIEFCRRAHAEAIHPNPLGNPSHLAEIRKALETKEKTSLHQLYSQNTNPQHEDREDGQNEWDSCVSEYVEYLARIRLGFEGRSATSHLHALTEVEQEREDEIEVESVRAIEKPIENLARQHCFHADIKMFVQTGTLTQGSRAFFQAFSTVKQTGLGKHHKMNIKAMSTRLFVTVDFINTINQRPDLSTDDYLRSVQWIVWRPREDTALIVSPYEAEEILSLLRHAPGFGAHLVSYSAPVTRSMLRFNNLNFYAFPQIAEGIRAPPWLKRDIGIFAGQLYFPFSEYGSLVEYLGLVPGRNMKNQSSSLTINRHSAVFLREWLSLRRRSHDIMDTPMGLICQGIPLFSGDAFFQSFYKPNQPEPQADSGAQEHFHQTLDSNEESEPGIYDD